jgi:hypothetical protein
VIGVIFFVCSLCGLAHTCVIAFVYVILYAVLKKAAFWGDFGRFGAIFWLVVF